MAASMSSPLLLCLLVCLAVAVVPAHGQCLIARRNATRGGMRDGTRNCTGVGVQSFNRRGNLTVLLEFQRGLRCCNPNGSCRNGCELHATYVRLARYDYRANFDCTCRGAATGDPKFQGFDGSVFWFHGKREMSWCISSDNNLHINAYFSGKAASEIVPTDPAALEGPRKGKPHDLTWVQKLAFLFGKHTLIVEAIQEAGWDKQLDHLSVVFDGKPVELPPFVRHRNPPAQQFIAASKSHRISLIRVNTKNQMKLDIEGLVSVFIKVIPTKNTTWTATSSFVHIDTEYTFLRPTPKINGVLGRTLSTLTEQQQTGEIGDKEEAEAAAIKASTPYILWDLDNYSTSDLTAADCKVSQFDPNVLVDVTSQAGMPLEPTHIMCSGKAGDKGMSCR